MVQEGPRLVHDMLNYRQQLVKCLHSLPAITATHMEKHRQAEEQGWKHACTVSRVNTQTYRLPRCFSLAAGGVGLQAKAQLDPRAAVREQQQQLLRYCLSIVMRPKPPGGAPARVKPRA